MLAAAEGAEECVKFVGSIGHSSIAALMNAADVVLLPSYAEGVPNVLLESQACGTPVVASNVGGIPEVTSELSSRLLSPGNVQGFASAIIEFLESPPDRLAIRKGVEPFTWSRSAMMLAALLGQATAGDGRRGRKLAQ
jgi:glycosyltransferase involved in cell wall biosynthesis